MKFVTSPLRFIIRAEHVAKGLLKTIFRGKLFAAFCRSGEFYMREHLF